MDLSSIEFSTGPLLLYISIFEGVVLIGLIVIGFKLQRLIKQYRSLMSGNEVEDLEEILLRLGRDGEKIKRRLGILEDSINRDRDKARYYFQKWSLLRYKAFANTGGDQSFSLALLDGNNNGLIISSIYGRDESRIYAKSIKNGKSSYPLSDEEQEVLARALGVG